jgi:hypothetical protein
VAKIYNRYEYYSHMAWDRYNEIKGLNDVEGLRGFVG